MLTKTQFEAALKPIKVMGSMPAHIESVSTDSRILKAGDVFVALVGERFDAHTLVGEALQKGASAVIVHQEVDTTLFPEACVIYVDDTLLAYQRLALAWRNAWDKHHDKTVIAIVGSNGKTTTKAWAAQLARAKWGHEAVLVTEANWNNQIGVAKMILSLTDHHQVAVLEAGISEVGEMTRLGRMMKANIAIITNAHKEHQEFLKTVATSAYENGLVMQAMEKPATVIFPLESEGTPIWTQEAQDFGVKIHPFGVNVKETSHAPGTLSSWKDGVLLIDGLEPMTPRFDGVHFAHNATAIAALGMELGMSPRAIMGVLAELSPLPGRGAASVHGHVTLIDDAYNANPDSMAASLHRVASYPEPKLFVMGAMEEVGENSQAEHALVGSLAKTLGVTLWTVGEKAQASSLAYGPQARHFADLEAVLAALKDIKTGTVVLKASHSSGLYKLVEPLKAHWETNL